MIVPQADATRETGWQTAFENMCNTRHLYGLDPRKNEETRLFGKSEPVHFGPLRRLRDRPFLKVEESLEIWRKCLRFFPMPPSVGVMAQRLSVRHSSCEYKCRQILFSIAGR